MKVELPRNVRGLMMRTPRSVLREVEMEMMPQQSRFYQLSSRASIPPFLHERSHSRPCKFAFEGIESPCLGYFRHSQQRVEAGERMSS